jgi:hypothetical protein
MKTINGCLLFINLNIKKIILIFLLGITCSQYSGAQKSSLILLGDLHYDVLGDHDMEWLRTKPDDLRQVTKEYTLYTEKYWNDFMTLLRNRVLKIKPEVKAIIQLGDLSEGLAGSEEKAGQMASNAMKAVDNSCMPVPWIITKGNHDMTGPGAPEAFIKHYVPMFRKQTGNQGINNASYSWTYGRVQITVVDPWDRNTDMVRFLEKELSESKAKLKFVAIHEPVIPVTERCWHTFRGDPVQREKLLEVIARNKAIVLCAHLHRYSVVRRNTKFGPVVQVMANSVIKDSAYQTPSFMITEYGPSLAENKPEWQPETLEARKAILAEEAKYVTFYRQTDLPGFGVLKINEKKGTVDLEYYAAFGRKPFDKVSLTGLMKTRSID